MRTGEIRPGWRATGRLARQSRDFKILAQISRRERYGSDRAGFPRRGAKAAIKLPWPVALFLIGLIIPWVVPIGPLNMPVYRIVLVMILLPCIGAWASGKAGPIRLADICVFVFSLWAGLSLLVAHGLAFALQPAGAFFVESVGAYLLARCYIRNAESFHGMIVLMVKLIVILLPFAVYECLTGSKPLLAAFGSVFPTVDSTMMTPRMGLWRVQGPFEHSILFGTIIGSMFALTFGVAARDRPMRRMLLAGVVCFTAILSLSSAPLAGLILQLGLLAWAQFLKALACRWKLLLAIAFVAYLVVEFGSNQTPAQFYISKFTFDPQTGWYRLWIWEYGTAAVLNHPLFGLGLNDWPRPSWMHSGSVDNFWLIIAMRYGIPAVAALVVACLAVVVPVARCNLHDVKLGNCRTAYLICMASLFFVGTTVHYWDATYVWFIFLLGSGVWMLDTNADAARGVIPTSSLARLGRSVSEKNGANRQLRPTRPTRRGFSDAAGQHADSR